jgi:hypothetical protein
MAGNDNHGADGIMLENLCDNLFIALKRKFPAEIILKMIGTPDPYPWVRVYTARNRSPMHNILFHALKHGNTVVIQHILAKMPELAHQRNVHDETPLHVAMQDDASSAHVLRQLIADRSEMAEQVDINLRQTPLHYAMYGTICFQVCCVF